MKFTLFSKELFGGRKKLVIFCFISFLIYLLVAIQVVLSAESSGCVAVPDVVFSGKIDGNAISYEKYGNIKMGFADLIVGELEDKADVYELIERNIITVQKENSLESVTYSIFACSHSFFEDRLSALMSEGTIPLEGIRQAVIGGYLAKAFHIEVGDVITKKSVNLANLGMVDIVLDLSGDFREIEYEVVGILDDTEGYFDYAFLIGGETQGNISCNTVWVYFLSDDVIDLYIEKIVETDKSFFSENGIGTVLEPYHHKEQGLFSLILKNGYLFLLAAVFSYILIAYVLKGVTYKLGIMKAIGISDQYIYKCYFTGIFVIQIVSYILSFVVVHFLCVLLNRSISEAYGYDVNLYRVTFNMFFVVTMMLVITLAAFHLSLYYRINHIKPKAAMSIKA